MWGGETPATFFLLKHDFGLVEIFVIYVQQTVVVGNRVILDILSTFGMCAPLFNNTVATYYRYWGGKSGSFCGFGLL